MIEELIIDLGLCRAGHKSRRCLNDDSLRQYPAGKTTRQR
jgi:hypothetical protein